ncbi:MAG: DMT family transporter [Lautropia sp.]|nr:DMT family transporter [Lautropia sp.]
MNADTAANRTGGGTCMAGARHAPWLLLVLTLIWGTNWPLFHLAVREISVWTFRAATLPVAGLLLLLVARHRGQSLRIPRAHWPMMVLTAWCFLSVWNTATTLATTLIPSGQVAILGFTMPLWATLLGWVLLRQRLQGRHLMALGLGMAGVITLMVPAFHAYAQAPFGLFLGLLSGIGWALSTVLLKHRPIPVPMMVLTGWQLLIAALPILVIAGWQGDYQWFMPSATSVLVIGYIMLVPMLLGNLLWFTLVNWLPAHLVALSPIMVPVVAMISGALALNEPLGPRQWAAMVLCASALALVLFKRPRPAVVAGHARAQGRDDAKTASSLGLNPAAPSAGQPPERPAPDSANR